MDTIELTYAILEVLAACQGIVVGIYLVIKSTRKKPTFFLGLFLFLFALEILPSALKDFGIWDKWESFDYLPFKNIWLLSPIFLVYTQQVSVFQNKSKYLWLFIPGALFFSFRILLNFLPSQLFGIENFVGKYDDVVFLIGHFFCLAVGSYNLFVINRHIKTVNRYFSSLYMKELKWARTFIYFGYCFCLVSLVMLISVSHFSLVRLPFLLAQLFTVYWLGFYGSKQLNVYKVLGKPEAYGLTFKTKVRKQEYKKENPELGRLMVQLQQFFQTKEPFTDPELNLIGVAQSLDVHPKKLSAAINSYGGTNFNRYVNNYRVEIAKKKLLDPAYENLSIEGIGQEVGFSSKSAFYNAFNSMVGTTPLEFKRRHFGKN